MPDIYGQISNLEQIAAKMVVTYRELQSKNHDLQGKVDDLELKIREKNSQLALLESELKNARVVQGISRGGEEVELARAKIGSLVREIDRCIAMLNG